MADSCEAGATSVDAMIAAISALFLSVRCVLMIVFLSPDVH